MYTRYTFIHLSTVLHLLFTINIEFSRARCNNAEYEINGECCPMCDPGKRVKTHCDEETSTTCYSCPAMTYTSVPNGFTECLSCSVCDPNNGLREKQACTSTSDTLCGPLTHYYCVDQLFNCKKAIKHSTCSPGQYINQTGTEFSDTVCYNCPAGSHSDGTFCKLHTVCESLGKITIKMGTETSDAECSSGTSNLLIVVLSVCLVLFCLIALGIFLIVMKKKYLAVSQREVTSHS